MYLSENEYEANQNAFLQSAIELLKQYEIEIPEDALKFFFYSFSERCVNEIELKPNFDLIELAKFSVILKDALANKSKFTISANYKNSITKVEISEIENLKFLMYYIDSLLYNNQRGLYNLLFDNSFKKESLYTGSNNENIIFSPINMIDYEFSSVKSLFSGFTEPYSKSQLETILEYENNTQLDYQKNHKTWYNRQIKIVVEYMRDKGYFNAKYKTISTKEACLIYDLIVIIGHVDFSISNTMNSQEKYQFIKRYLKSN